MSFVFSYQRVGHTLTTQCSSLRKNTCDGAKSIDDGNSNEELNEECNYKKFALLTLLLRF